MNIVIFSQYPRFDKLAWKEKALRNLTASGMKPTAIIYSNVGIFASMKVGLKRYGFRGMMKELRTPGGNGEVGSKMFSRKLKSVAKELNIPVYYVKSHNGKRCRGILEKIEPDLILLWGTGIIRKEILNTSKIGTLNGHYAILPKIRGMNVTEWSILLGEETGISIHFVSPGVDLGDILYTQKFSIDKGDTLESIRLKCQENTSAAFVKVVKDIKENKHRSVKQNLDDGKQYFVMNPLLKKILKKKLEIL